MTDYTPERVEPDPYAVKELEALCDAADGEDDWEPLKALVRLGYVGVEGIKAAREHNALVEALEAQGYCDHVTDKEYAAKQDVLQSIAKSVAERRLA